MSSGSATGGREHAADPFLGEGQTYGAVTGAISTITLDHPGQRRWLILFACALALLGLFAISLSYLLIAGVGIWGNNIPVTWGFDIINYVWWIGIGNAGTLISALLLMLRQTWRNAINRMAEAMTLMAAVCAAIYPVIHLGRPWYFYWNLPYPNTMLLWPQFRSPLFWDAMAIMIYLTTSLLFWYIGLIPDLATMRDRARTRFRRQAYGVFALGWRGSSRHWARWRQAYVTIAACAVPLVVAVHSGVGLLFAASIEPGWHGTIQPPFFVFGAAFSGFAVVAMIAVTVRHAFGIDGIVTAGHLDMLGKAMLGTGLATAYGYLMELFTTWYGGESFEQALMLERLGGVYAWSFWGVILCNVVVIQTLWFRAVRRNSLALFTIGLGVAAGMWFERFMIIVITLHHDFLPSSSHLYTPSFWDLSTFAGSVGLFLTAMLLFIRYVPVVSIFEVREMAVPDRSS
ncbi:NrfD/PsrC family molybdoenzyme membrane anchor subunit [Marinivivus vitaminiproducens]|uniref:NrfD/PsrC family molybdoenzyme membrane anchor subunit n=1 Tax=Marinivivus vitaminiproducens TaxID=3035935 RepID=UPI0027AA0AB4|nr:polysulfide reductase NrfD [Geminicoccaceae bacterium SCSIO 64248]